MPASFPSPTATKNHLLTALLSKDYMHLLPLLERVTLALGEVLYEAESPIQYVYFPETAVISMLSTMESGDTVEVGLVGREGMLGIRIFLGSRTTPHAAVVQAAGSALRMKTHLLEAELRTGSSLQSLLLRYTQTLLTQIRESAAGNMHHSVEQRLARWLLTMHDHTESDELQLTHELIGMMLGSRRASVTGGAGKLQEAGLISYTRGTIRLLDRQGLEGAACECYRLMKEEFDGLYAAQVPSREIA